MQKWEYWVKEMVITDRWTTKGAAEERSAMSATLNEAGDAGWELVSYQAMPVVGSVMANTIKSYAYMAIFKRPKG